MNRLLHFDGEWFPLQLLPRTHGTPLLVRTSPGESAEPCVVRKARVINPKTGAILLESPTGQRVDIARVHSWKPDDTGSLLPLDEFEDDEGQEHFLRAVEAVLDERSRQVLKLGFTQSHDDCHRKGELVDLAVAYARAAQGIIQLGRSEDAPRFKPSPDPVRNLIKAAACLIAEIERRRRLQPPPSAPASSLPEPQTQPAAA